MFRLSGLLSLCLAVICGSLLFLTSQSVQKAERKLSKAQQSNSAEVETLRVLSAEWDYLNRPERLERLTLGNLEMDNTEAAGKDFVESIQDIPQPIIPAMPKVKPQYFEYISAGQKKIISTDKAEPSVIEKSERERFDLLIEDVSKKGGQ